MANYIGCTRTNYFKIKDEAEFRKACENLVSEDNIFVEVVEKDGNKYGYIGSLSDILYCEDEDDYDLYVFFEKMQKVICEDDAMLWTEVGHEKLRYLYGICTVVTCDGIRYIDLDTAGKEIAKEMLEDDGWTTRNSY